MKAEHLNGQPWNERECPGLPRAPRVCWLNSVLGLLRAAEQGMLVGETFEQALQRSLVEGWLLDDGLDENIYRCGAGSCPHERAVVKIIAEPQAKS